LTDARDRLAEISDRAFADAFFDRFVEGRQVPDYAPLLLQAGIVVRKRNPGAAWSGVAVDGSGRVGALQGLVAWGAPAFDAGLEHGDVIVSVDGTPFAADAWRRRKPGETIALEVRRVDGRAAVLKLTFQEDPRLDARPAESTGLQLSPAQRAFRAAWLGPRAR
jgi:predicted metalloprotease with PDZ domain